MKTTANVVRATDRAVKALKKRDANDLNFFIDALRECLGKDPLHCGRYGAEDGANTAENKARKEEDRAA